MKITLDDAKEFYFENKCSKFAMVRENLPKYEIYLSLNISKDTEIKWAEEQLCKYYQEIISHNCCEKLWIVYNNMYELVESIKNNRSLTIMYEVVKFIVKDLTIKEKVIIAEIIIGRKDIEQRSGLIYISFDLGGKMKARLFADIALKLLSNISSADIEISNRVQNAKVICNKIVEELFIRESE